MKTKELLELLENKEYKKIKDLLSETNQVDIAEALSELDKVNLAVVFRMLKKDEAADVFSYLNPDSQKDLIESLTDKEIGNIINELFLDDAVDFIEEMPATVVTRVLNNANESIRKDINQFLQYDEDSAGSIMTNEFIDLKHSITVEEAFDVIRKKAFDRENIYTCYVKDETRKLVGLVSVKQLLLAPKGTIISSLMNTNVIKAKTTDDKELLANLFTKYGYPAIPIVDSEDRIVGIVTFDDAFVVIEEEATEDMEIMAALRPSEKPYLQTGVFRLAANRLTWLIVLMISGLLIGLIIEGFQDSISVLPILVGFIPMLMDTGGNCGSQSSTLIIRGMAVGEIKSKDWLKLLWKEFRVAFVVGVILGLIVVARIMIFNRNANQLSVGDISNSPIDLAYAVALTIFCTVIISKMLGAILPLISKILKLDPALMAAPLITSIADALSLIIYFGLLRIFIQGL